MKKLIATAQKKNDVFPLSIDPTNVVEIAKMLLAFKKQSNQKRYQPTLNELLNKLNDVLHHYCFQLTKERNHLSKIDCLEADLMTLIIYVKEIVPLLRSTDRKKLTTLSITSLKENLKNITKQNSAHTASISWA